METSDEKTLEQTLKEISDHTQEIRNYLREQKALSITIGFVWVIVPAIILIIICVMRLVLR